ncbi:hypothetical protein LAZ67_3004512 [Cordylochernes scorpioides]|uniref:Tc1-like transposase DDE domain-containing protein n=1 Tax=Cordylochernes scorpioides TaxID=51811 RepID=A0ABY6KCL9_9ARAC|nr:hypothetical protein LAZ67_3004512 [Cordylochernes scorpioides]
MHRKNVDQLFIRIVTGDESWVHHSTPETKRQSMVWKKPEESAPKKAKVTISAGKVMAIVFWDCKGVLLVDYLPPNTTVNAARYCEVLTKLRSAIKRKRPGLLSRKVLLIHDNTRPHAARTTQNVAEKLQTGNFHTPTIFSGTCPKRLPSFSCTQVGPYVKSQLIHTLVRPRCTDCGERWLEQGNVAIYRNVGATRVTSARVDQRIIRQAVAAPQATCTAILQYVQDTLDHSISTRTISRRLAPTLEWCRARSTWMTEWHRVVFSDESRFCLSSDSRRVRVWRRRGKRSNPAAIVERPTVRQRTMTAQRYVDDVLRPVTLPYLQGVLNALYQQDNARPHTARISQQALQDVQMLPWPPYSPDLSPIEHVWDIIGRRLHALPQPRQKTNCGKWLRGNGEPSLRTPSVL